MVEGRLKNIRKSEGECHFLPQPLVEKTLLCLNLLHHVGFHLQANQLLLAASMRMNQVLRVSLLDSPPREPLLYAIPKIIPLNFC